jgi:hypothetical protein
VRSFDDIEARIDELGKSANPLEAVAEMLMLGEEVLERWVTGRGQEPTQDTSEGFRILALHKQGARGEPSFNACRETCRELVYHHNLIEQSPEDEKAGQWLIMAGVVARHLLLFVGGKMEVEGLGEFCCSSQPLHQNDTQDQVMEQLKTGLRGETTHA